MQDFNEYLKEKKEIFEKRLFEIFDVVTENSPEILKKSMRYSLEAGGKRLRPILTYSVSEALGGNLHDALTIGCAIEFIHTYSLIHDDLPAMDNDDYRRGRLTNHKVFGEAVAILAGDALLTDAFFILSNSDFYEEISKEKQLKIIEIISKAVGSTGMVAGQVLDIIFENKFFTKDEVDKIHQNKTAKLIEASCLSGAIISTNDSMKIEKIRNFGFKIGLSFQIVDDLLDVIGDEKSLGKKVGKDMEKGKATYPACMGVEKSKEIAEKLVSEAKKEIEFLGEKGKILSSIADFFVKRVS